MAPEARLGHATRKSDQFSFGVSIVEALTGEPRPAGKPAPSGVPRGLWTVLRRATSPVASRRFPEMASLLAALAKKPRTGVWRPFALGFLMVACLGGGAFAWADGDVGSLPMRIRHLTSAVLRRSSRTSAPHACARLTGTHTLYTTSTDRPEMHGCYRVVFRQQVGCIAEADIAKTWSGSGDHRCPAEASLSDDVQRVQVHVKPDGGAMAVVSFPPREYRFTFTSISGQLGGRFSTKISGAPNDLGTIREVQ